MDRNLYQKRVAKCTTMMHKDEFDVLLLTGRSNLFYLTGDYRTNAFALITQSGKVALGVPETEIADAQTCARCDFLDGFEDEPTMIQSIKNQLQKLGINKGKIGLEYNNLTRSMADFLAQSDLLPAEKVFQDCSFLLTELRKVKEPDEIEHIRLAAHVADAGMKAAVYTIKPGITESEVAAEAEFAMRHSGADGFWGTYVTFGQRTSLSHGLPTQKKLKNGELVCIDIHPIVAGYSADICRTVCAGRPSPEQMSAYDLYLSTQQCSILNARPGTCVADIEKFFHESLVSSGKGQTNYGSIIHGVGIDLEDYPMTYSSIYQQKSREPLTLFPNTVVAIGNSGLSTGPWGIRVEDTVWISEKGPVILTSYLRQLANMA
ncbi:MAG: Xaa-Pro peptidase family protein [Anaerolineaceae bacterium]|nr:Xaa-Pro peptidase family protein [Anaerolineaceae bacterium]